MCSLRGLRIATTGERVASPRRVQILIRIEDGEPNRQKMRIPGKAGRSEKEASEHPGRN